MTLRPIDYSATDGVALRGFLADGSHGRRAAGILVAHEVARCLGVRGLFAERQEGALTLRRGFHIDPGERCYVVEDVVTTGGSTRETMEVVQWAGAEVIATGSLIDRSGGRTDLGVPRVALAVLDVPNYQPDECPLCKAGSVAVKPGSR